MQTSFFSALLAVAAVTTACVLPGDTLSNTITDGFGILIQNPAFPVIHDTYMNLDPAGGGDNHLFLAPVGNPTFNLVLEDGILEQDIIHAVIDGEYSVVDNTTKMFMTERGDPKAIFGPVYGCNPDNDAVQIELAFLTREDSPYGGLICVRIASGNRGYEFRYSPPDNPAFDPTNPCMPVTMVVIFASNLSTVSTTSINPSTSSSSPSTVSGGTSTTSSSPPNTTPTGPTQPATVNGVWTWYGCQTEATNTRALNLASFAADTMTLEACANFCLGYKYFGTEYARECYCGNSFNAGSVPALSTDCSFLCMGNALEFCGAGLRLSVYAYNPVQQSPSLSSSSSSTSSSLPSSSTQSSSISSSSQSTSATSVGSTSGSTTSSTSASQSSSLSSSSQSTSATSQFSSTSSTTSTSSTASASPTLGIKQTLGAYSLIGCYTEATNMRALTGASYYDYPAMTLEECLGRCAGFKYFGVEYGGECYCGNTINPGSVPAPLTDCSFICPGNEYEYCGAGVRLEMYELASAISSSSPATVSTSASASSAPSSSQSTSATSHISSTSSTLTVSQSTSTTSTASSSPLPFTDMTSYGFAYVGCAPEERTAPASPPGRTLSGPLYADNALTNAECMIFCSSNGYEFAGTEYTRECWCGNSVAPGREPQTTIVSLANCNFPCGGDPTQYCGGNSWLSLYQECAAGSPCVNAQFT